MSGGAHAQIVAFATYANAFVGTDSSIHTLPLDDTGATQLVFTTKHVNEPVAISYAAVCYIQTNGSELSVRILVDGQQASPVVTGVNVVYPMCSGQGYINDMVAATRSSVYVVPAIGTHTVEVQAQASMLNPSDLYLLADTTLIVQK